MTGVQTCALPISNVKSTKYRFCAEHVICQRCGDRREHVMLFYGDRVIWDHGYPGKLGTFLNDCGFHNDLERELQNAND